MNWRKIICKIIGHNWRVFDGKRYCAACGYEECSHEWHADQDNDCNFCVKCEARQEIYTK